MSRLDEIKVRADAATDGAFAVTWPTSQEDQP